MKNKNERFLVPLEDGQVGSASGAEEHHDNTRQSFNP